MRIATWNLNRSLPDGGQELLLGLDADVLLLTEAPPGLELPHYRRTPPGPLMSLGQEWNTILSRRPIRQVDYPHPTTTAAVIDGVTYVSSVLPWSSSVRDGYPGPGDGQIAQTLETLDVLNSYLHGQERLVWGGDWNHSLEEPWDGTPVASRTRLDQLLTDLGLHTPTRHEDRGPYKIKSIDHVAVRDPAATSRHVVAAVGTQRLSDHDAYVVDSAAH